MLTHLVQIGGATFLTSFWAFEGWHRHGRSHITAALFSWYPRHLISISFLSSPARGLTLYIRWKAWSRMIFEWSFLCKQ